jgi:hypothetical protein
VMKKDQREQSERFFFTRQEDHVINVIMIADSILISCFFFRRINHMALKPFALMLCLHAAVHQVANRSANLESKKKPIILKKISETNNVKF